MTEQQMPLVSGAPVSDSREGPVDGAWPFVDVAVPVPLRRTFSYAVPESLMGKLAIGMRVAVPFSGRKVPAVVVGFRADRPEGVKRVMKVGGLLEEEVVFDPELLAFLHAAADYYIHPLGEVLRAAAPAMPRGALRRLARSGFIEAADELKGKQMAVRRSWRIRLAAALRPASSAPSPAGEGEDGAPGAPDEATALTESRALASEDLPRGLGTRQRAALALLHARGELWLEELRAHLPEARTVIRGLANRGLVEFEEQDLPLDPFFARQLPREAPFTPNEEQARAIDALCERLEKQRAGGFLLHGVTGSGKTEVYLQVVARALASGLGVVVLVPEIALTPQLVGRFRARFGEGIAVLHSGLGDRERHDAWRGLRKGELHLAIGARSALFAPVKNLGLIIVDEEHDPSFKQEDGFRYHGRDMALLRAHRAGAQCILGSATPSLEATQLVRDGKLERLVLSRRALEQSMPEVEIIDLARNPGKGPGGHPLITGPMHRALQKCLEAGHQAILFLNRRGYSPTLCCTACGEVLRCPACSVSLTEHRRAGVLRCHYCDFSAPLQQPCRACGSSEVEPLGVGTERVEEALQDSFAGVRVARLDRDTASGRGVEEVLDRMRNREVDVLVGTQMVTKGHDLPGVTLVGVLLADQSLAFPDFRAGERTFQLLTQVAGRAGRGDEPGRVLLQTYQPRHPVILHALDHDYGRFFETEIEARSELLYPPFSRLVAIRVDAGDEEVAKHSTEGLARLARGQAVVREGRVDVLGPAPAPVARVRGRYRYRLLLRSPDRAALRAVAMLLSERIDGGIAPARASVDVDPVSML